MENADSIKSYWNAELKSKVIENGSDTLAVLVPGIGYTCDRPLLDYSKRLMIQLGFDVLPISFGFQVAGKTIDLSEEYKYITQGTKEFGYMYNETKELINMSLKEKYKNIIFVAKSVGTLISSLLNKDFSDRNIINIDLTPIDGTMEAGIYEDSLTFYGTKDPRISLETVSKIKKIKGVSLFKIEDANHSLNIENDVLKSIDIVKYVIEKEKEYLAKFF